MALLAGLFSGAPVPAFVEREAWERGFAQIFARDLAPQLAALEMQRRLTLAGLAAAAAVDAVLVYFIVIIIGENPALRWEVKLLAVVAGLVTTACLWLVSRFVRREQRVVLPLVCRQFGPLEVDVAPKAPTSALEPYWALALIRKPRATSRSAKPVKLSVRDLITGAYRAIGLRLVELDAYDGSSFDLKSMFRGTVIELALPGPGNAYAPWRFDRSVLTRIAEVLPGEPATAAGPPVTEVGTPAVARALLGMAAALGTDSLCGAASGSDVYIAIPRARKRRPLTATSIWSPVYRCEPAIRAALAEFAAVFRLLDAVAEACAEPAAATAAAGCAAQTSPAKGADDAAPAGAASPSSPGTPGGQKITGRSPTTSWRVAVIPLLVLLLGAAAVLVNMLSTRIGGRHDDAAAMGRYREAADRGDANAQNSMGNLYWNGSGVTRDYGEAMRWYRLAADQGHATAQNNIGWLYQNGRGVAQDYDEARRWYRLAADRGDARAQHNIGWLYQNGWGVTQDYGEAMRWYRKSADQGNAIGQNNIGWLYQNGWGVAQDYGEAMRWYRTAADQGLARAKYHIATLYANGWGVPGDQGEARAWMQRAAAGGEQDAKKWLGTQ